MKMCVALIALALCLPVVADDVYNSSKRVTFLYPNGSMDQGRSLGSHIGGVMPTPWSMVRPKVVVVYVPVPVPCRDSRVSTPQPLPAETGASTAMPQVAEPVRLDVEAELVKWRARRLENIQDPALEKVAASQVKFLVRLQSETDESRQRKMVASYLNTQQSVALRNLFPSA